MSTIKSSAEHLTLNADGASKDIKFQANGVEKASISSAGAFTSTTIDATALTGDLPAISGANLTGVGVAGITSSADATFIIPDDEVDEFARIDSSLICDSNREFIEKFHKHYDKWDSWIPESPLDKILKNAINKIEV